MITPKGVEPSTRNVSPRIEIIKKVLADLDRLQKSGRKFNIDKAIGAYRWRNPLVKKEEIESVLMFLSSPPFNIVRKEEDGAYSLTLDYAETRKRLGLLHETLPIEGRRPIEPEKGEERGIRIKGEFIPCRRSKDILVETAEWLIERGKLKAPVEARYRPYLSAYRRYLVSREPKHKSGEPFRAGKKLSNGWWMETHYSTRACIRNAQRLLKECGLRKEDLTEHGFS